MHLPTMPFIKCRFLKQKNSTDLPKESVDDLDTDKPPTCYLVLKHSHCRSQGCIVDM